MTFKPTLTPLAQQIRNRLEAICRPDEVVSPIVPHLLSAGRWWPDTWTWPSTLTAGLIEPRRGYRFKPENTALAQLLWGQRALRVLDLGAGSGSLLLIAMNITRPRCAVAVERQPDQAERLERTLQAHRHPTATQVLSTDLRAAHCQIQQALGGMADLIVANPPFFPAGWGRPSREPSTHLSTHASHGGVADFVHTGAALLAEDGRMMVVFDAGRVGELIAAAGAARLRLRHLAWIADQRPEAQPEPLPFRVWVTLSHSGTPVERLL